MKNPLDCSNGSLNMLYYYNTFLPRLSVRMEMMMGSSVFHVDVKVKGIFEFTKEKFKIKQKDSTSL
ncbi:MAG: hypothetical protein ACFCUL_00595 [Flavobacteriaceae bacterium]